MQNLYRGVKAIEKSQSLISSCGSSSFKIMSLITVSAALVPKCGSALFICFLPRIWFEKTKLMKFTNYFALVQTLCALL
jgi:hypothetical protein